MSEIAAGATLHRKRKSGRGAKVSFFYNNCPPRGCRSIISKKHEKLVGRRGFNFAPCASHSYFVKVAEVPKLESSALALAAASLKYHQT